MNILDLDDIPLHERKLNSVKVIQDWGYTDRGRFVEDYVWKVSANGESISWCLGKEQGIQSALKYAEENKIETIYFSSARKSYYKSK